MTKNHTFMPLLVSASPWFDGGEVWPCLIALSAKLGIEVIARLVEF